MNVLVACEFSGIVREAFKKQGHNAMSCDLMPTEIPGNHIQGDVLEWLKGFWHEDNYLRHFNKLQEWDMLIAFPPCTHLAVSGARWFKGKQKEQFAALAFVSALLAAPIARIALENPIGIISTRIQKPDQIIQPWQFGHGETKATCLWLKNLPLLQPTSIVEGRKPRVHHEPPSKDRWKNRSRTYQGIADAMAEQWGNEVEEIKGKK